MFLSLFRIVKPILLKRPVYYCVLYEVLQKKREIRSRQSVTMADSSIVDTLLCFSFQSTHNC